MHELISHNEMGRDHFGITGLTKGDDVTSFVNRVEANYEVCEAATLKDLAKKAAGTFLTLTLLLNAGHAKGADNKPSNSELQHKVEQARDALHNEIKKAAKAAKHPEYKFEVQVYKPEGFKIVNVTYVIIDPENDARATVTINSVGQNRSGDIKIDASASSELEQFAKAWHDRFFAEYKSQM